MKNRWVYIPVILSFVLLVAHFSRNDQYFFLILSALIPWLLLVKASWSRLVVQLSLVAGAFAWAWSTLDYMEIRKSMNEDYQRLAIILFSVAAFTLVSALLLYLVRPKKGKAG